MRKIGAIKVVNARGQTVYSLPRAASSPMTTPRKEDWILHIVANETLVVIFTSPGSASMVALVLDYNQITTEILGTLAGDDTFWYTEVGQGYHELKTRSRDCESCFASARIFCFSSTRRVGVHLIHLDPLFSY